MSSLTNLTLFTVNQSFSLPYFVPTLSISPRSANAATETVTATAIIIPPNPPKVSLPPTPTTTTKPRKTEFWGFPINWVTSTKTVYDWDRDGVEDWKTMGVSGVGAVMNGNSDGVRDGNGDVDFDALAAAAVLTMPGVPIPSTLATVTRPSASTLPSGTGPVSVPAFPSVTASASIPPVPTAPVSIADSTNTEIHKRDKNFFLTLTATAWVTRTISGMFVTQTRVVTLETGAVMPPPTETMKGEPAVTVGGNL